jgi:hypothetical protein
MDGNMRRRVHTRQRGAVLFLLLLLFVVGGITVFALSPGTTDVEEAKRAHDRDVLRQAKQAVIAYAAYRHNPNDGPPPDNVRPGELLCPDKNYDGRSTAASEGCGNRCCTYRGWLPYKTLDTEEPKDSSGARLWYAVSDAYQTFKEFPDNPLNSAIPGGLALNGNQVVAVIIAPGESLCFQDGRADALDSPDAVTAGGEFLDYKNNDGDPTQPDNTDASEYYTRLENDTPAPCTDAIEYANDLLISITQKDIWRQSAGWPLQYAKDSLDGYHRRDFDGDGDADNRLPFPKNNGGDCSSVAYAAGQPMYSGLLPIDNDGACDGDDALSTAPAWFTGNRWDELIYYIVSGDCVSPGSCSGAGGVLRLNADPFDGLVIEAGAELTGTECANQGNNDYLQNRANSASVCEYLDLAENTDTNDDLIFVRPASDDFSNDRFMPLDY